MFFEILHYLIGLFIVSLLVYFIIKSHKYFSKNNKQLTSQTMTEQFIGRQVQQPQIGAKAK